MADRASEQSIFWHAIGLGSAAERSAYLDRACGDDTKLRADIVALLAAHDRLGGPPQAEEDGTDGPAATAEAAPPTPADRSRMRVGPYKLLEPIGEGGMGTVYLAEQKAPVRRMVALKVIKAGMDSRQVLARFDAERQALALMDHPNIAKVLDAGTTEQGRPYFAMELVKGVPITRYCDERRLTPRKRLELFIPVCQAVQHAHQKGVIHRDLKPSNVLVGLYDGQPVPKIIDFGVAKATGQKLTEATLFTGFGAVVGTPEYMSPEQAQLDNLDIDTRSDVYALGVLLYELLTGTTPLDRKRLKEAAILEILRVIREEEPPRPSTRLSTTEELPSIAANRSIEPRKLSGLVRGELDWIVMRALEKDRRRRYETANGLAADLRRYLNHEPLEAGPPSAWYRLRKYARRNRAVLVTAAVVAAALVAGTAVSTWQAIRATQACELAQRRLEAEQKARGEVDLARQEADRRATEAREVVDFLINDMIGATAPSRAQGKIPTVDQVLAKAEERIPQKFAGRPLIEASIRHALGKAYEELGLHQTAEQHAARAVELRLKYLGPEHADTIAAQNALGRALYRWRALFRRSEVEEARTLLAPVLEAARKALGPEHEETLQTMHALATALVYLDRDEARARLEELLVLRKQVSGPEHPKTLEVMNDLAMIWGFSGDLEKAKHLSEQVVAIALRKQPNHPDTLEWMNGLADFYDRSKQYDRGIDMRRRVMEGCVRILGPAHPFTLRAIGEFYFFARGHRAHWDEARKVLEPMMDRRTIALIDALPESRETLDLRAQLAHFFYMYDHRDAALVQLRRAEAMRPRLLPVDDPLGLGIRADLALVLREQGRFAEARPLLEQIVAEALRLHKKVPNWERCIDVPRGLARFLLGRWPGLAPGIHPADRPPASFAIEAPFRAQGLIADGRIAPGEYGPGIEARFDDNANPGRLWSGGKSRSKTPDDLSVRIHTAYTDRSLFLAFQVRDQFIDVSEEDDNEAMTNDGVEVFINGDQVANDLTPVSTFFPNGNREGFQLGADAGGHRGTNSLDFANADWKVGTSRTPDGYIIEFEIPLALIDTKDGPEFQPATCGSELLVNFGIMDNDAPGPAKTDYAIFWAEDPDLSPFYGGEDFWTVSLRLVPKPEGP